MSRFAIDVTREGGWWMVHIPELGGLTQARYPGEVELTARAYIAVSTGTPIDQVAINWRRCPL
jgi:DNA-binding sugar fermentation-stimulating protein